MKNDELVLYMGGDRQPPPDAQGPSRLEGGSFGRHTTSDRHTWICQEVRKISVLSGSWTS